MHSLKCLIDKKRKVRYPINKKGFSCFIEHDWGITGLTPMRRDCMARDKNKDELKDNVLEHEFREQAQESMEEVRFSHDKKQGSETDQEEQK